ncbi:MAG: hypothetical protein JNM56_26060 [Planctomycetia bacterium]|nr:hypothetical protein [Planctomycetia bacterium]
MIPRLLIIAASVLAGALSTLFIRKAVIGDDPGLPELPEQVFRPRRRSPRTQLDVRSDGQGVEP